MKPDVFFSLPLKGEEGAFKVLNIFKEELKITMALCGKVIILILCALLSQIPSVNCTIACMLGNPLTNE
jgi:hypothetical protein